jgi:hypothetical protein
VTLLLLIAGPCRHPSGEVADAVDGLAWEEMAAEPLAACCLTPDKRRLSAAILRATMAPADTITALVTEAAVISREIASALHREKVSGTPSTSVRGEGVASPTFFRPFRSAASTTWSSSQRNGQPLQEGAGLVPPEATSVTAARSPELSSSASREAEL